VAIEVVMPKFGLTMQEGTIQQWFKAEGERIAAGEALFEVETEKVLYEVESPAAGVVARILYPVEATVPVANVVAVIAEDDEDPVHVGARYAAPAAPPAAETASPAPSAPTAGAAAGGDRRPITPAARKLAKEHGVDLGQVAGSGPGGRITREDIEAFLAQPRAVAPTVPLRGARKVIAARMFQSLQTTAQLTVTTEADVTAMVQRRDQLKAEFPLTYTDLIVEAVATALRQHPHVNATATADAIQLHSEIHIGIAVALDDGLIVPVIRNADRLAVRDIAAESRRLADAARRGTLSPDDLTGGTFTITNLGVYGIDAFTPIIHLPQVAILGIGRVVPKPAVHDGAIAIRQLMTLSLTFDHRVIDGAPAAAFLQTVVRHLGADRGGP